MGNESKHHENKKGLYGQKSWERMEAITIMAKAVGCPMVVVVGQAVK